MSSIGGYLGVGLAAAIALSAPATVSAQTATGQGSPFNTYTSIANTGTFGNNNQSNFTGSFTNVFTFTVTRAGTLFTSLFTNSGGLRSHDVNFRSATISGGTLSGTQNYAFSPNGAYEKGSFGPLSVGAGLYTVTIVGRAVGRLGTYAGQFSVAGVPEPGAWALMIGGFGLAGLALRRRRRNVTTPVSFA